MSTGLLTIDIETYYDSTYSLSKMTTEEYLRDDRFEVIGVSVKSDQAPPQWFSGTHQATESFLRKYDWEGSAALAHNSPFDMGILSYHFDIRPKLILDSLSMARAIVGQRTGMSLDALAKYFNLGVKGRNVIGALGKHRGDFSHGELAEYGDYCCNDGDLCYGLFNVLRGGFTKEEIQLIDLTIRMQTEPVLVLDEAKLRTYLGEIVHRKGILLERLGERHGKDVLMSNPKFADALRSFGVEPPMKVSPTTGKDTYAFAKSDTGLVSLAEHENPDVQALVAARLGVKSTIEETRTERLIGIAERGTLPISLRYYAAHTGRWGGDGKINPQNFGKNSPIRKAIKAPKGYVLVDADSSQIEARTLAWLAGQWDLVEAFSKGIDVYKLMSMDIYDLTMEEIDAMQRFVGKTVVLGCGYGTGAEKLQITLRNAKPSILLDRAECQFIIDTYRRKNHRITNFWWEAGEALSCMVTNRTCKLGEHPGVLQVEGTDGIRLPNGMYLEYPNLRWEAYKEDERPGYIYDGIRGKTKTRLRIYGASCVENITQAVARVIIGEQMLLIKKRYKVALTVHDAICAVVPVEEQAEAEAFVEACMRTRPTWAPDLPLACEVGSGESYGDC